IVYLIVATMADDIKIIVTQNAKQKADPNVKIFISPCSNCYYNSSTCQHILSTHNTLKSSILTKRSTLVTCISSSRHPCHAAAQPLSRKGKPSSNDSTTIDVSNPRLVKIEKNTPNFGRIVSNVPQPKHLE